jgi:hypothetical protein
MAVLKPRNRRLCLSVSNPKRLRISNLAHMPLQMVDAAHINCRKQVDTRTLILETSVVGRALLTSCDRLRSGRIWSLRKTQTSIFSED